MLKNSKILVVTITGKGDNEGIRRLGNKKKHGYTPEI